MGDMYAERRQASTNSLAAVSKPFLAIEHGIGSLGHPVASDERGNTRCGRSILGCLLGGIYELRERGTKSSNLSSSRFFIECLNI